MQIPFYFWNKKYEGSNEMYNKINPDFKSLKKKIETDKLHWLK